MALEALLQHTCDIFAPTSADATNEFGEVDFEYGMTATSLGNKCRFDVRPVGIMGGIDDSKTHGYTHEVPFLFLPAVLDQGYIPKNGDLIKRTDSLDAQYLNKFYRITKVWNVEKTHHYEALMELVND